MESSSPSVQCHHFQLCQLPRKEVEKNATTNRKRDNCGKIEADVELGFVHCKLSYIAEFECIKSSVYTQSTQSEIIRISKSVQRNLPLEIQIRMTPRRVLKCGNETQKRKAMRRNSLLQDRTKIWVFRTVQRNLPQKIPKSSTTTTRSGRTKNSTFLEFTLHISTKSTRRQQLNRKPEDKIEDLDVNTLIWWMFKTVTLQAALHLGNDHLENPHSTKKQPQWTV